MKTARRRLTADCISGAETDSGQDGRSAGAEDADGALAHHQRLVRRHGRNIVARDREGVNVHIERRANLGKGQALLAALIEGLRLGAIAVIVVQMSRQLCRFTGPLRGPVRQGVRKSHLLGQHQQ